ncbi:hypothetical protein AAVH_02831 [Aphelenchoides avenae]|nr:hypothetical protein AAVH_02831 [Aphelenchus avenae]
MTQILSSTDAASTIFQCYSCVSGTLSDVSREMFSQILPSALAVKNNSMCDDPFTNKNAALVEPCSSSCVKVVSSNKYTKLLLRGCLSSIYQRVGSGDTGPFKKPEDGKCDEQTQTTADLGSVVTRTCLCNTDRCNGANAVHSMGFVIIASLIASVNWILMSSNTGGDKAFTALRDRHASGELPNEQPTPSSTPAVDTGYTAEDVYSLVQQEKP